MIKNEIDKLQTQKTSIAAFRDALQHTGCSAKKNQLPINPIPNPLQAERQSNLEGMQSRVVYDRTK